MPGVDGKLKLVGTRHVEIDLGNKSSRHHEFSARRFFAAVGILPSCCYSSSTYDNHLRGIPPNSLHQLCFTDLELGAYLVEAVTAIEKARQL